MSSKKRRRSRGKDRKRDTKARGSGKNYQDFDSPKEIYRVTGNFSQDKKPLNFLESIQSYKNLRSSNHAQQDVINNNASTSTQLNSGKKRSRNHVKEEKFDVKGSCKKIKIEMDDLQRMVDSLKHKFSRCQDCLGPEERSQYNLEIKGLQDLIVEMASEINKKDQVIKKVIKMSSNLL